VERERDQWEREEDRTRVQWVHDEDEEAAKEGERVRYFALASVTRLRSSYHLFVADRAARSKEYGRWHAKFVDRK